MNFSRLKRADDSEVEKWIKENINITDYGARRLVDEELIRFSPFKFYKKREIKKKNFLWRLTAPVFILYCIVMMFAIPFKWLFTGDRYLPQKFLDGFHYRWIEKMGWE